MKPRSVVVATHGHCFDGLASAAVFTRLLGAVRDGAALSMRYRSCGYGPGMSTVPAGWLDGDENAILDFRYTPTDRLTWYFDHHITAFGSEEEESRARAGARPEGPHVFYDATYGSCTKLVADVAREHFALEFPELEELVRWADIVDAARFASAADAVRRDEPVLQLAAVVEQHGDAPLLTKLIPELLARPLADVARGADVQELWRPIATAQDAFRERVAERGVVRGRVLVVDLADALHAGGAKFVTYALFPEAVYSVTLFRQKQHYKLSIGYNPWSGAERDRDIASICRRYGGGGHPAVGAASFPLSELARAREVLETVARELEG